MTAGDVCSWQKETINMSQEKQLVFKVTCVGIISFYLFQSEDREYLHLDLGGFFSRQKGNLKVLDTNYLKKQSCLNNHSCNSQSQWCSALVAHEITIFFLNNQLQCLSLNLQHTQYRPGSALCCGSSSYCVQPSWDLLSVLPTFTPGQHGPVSSLNGSGGSHLVQPSLTFHPQLRERMSLT